MHGLRKRRLLSEPPHFPHVSEQPLQKSGVRVADAGRPQRQHLWAEVIRTPQERRDLQIRRRTQTKINPPLPKVRQSLRLMPTCQAAWGQSQPCLFTHMHAPRKTNHGFAPLQRPKLLPFVAQTLLWQPTRSLPYARIPVETRVWHALETPTASHRCPAVTCVRTRKSRCVSLTLPRWRLEEHQA